MAGMYQKSVLKPIMKPLNDTLFAEVDWTFQHDHGGGGGHTAKCMQKWLVENILNFMRKENWTSGSPDLNRLDYKIWEK